MNVKVWIEKWKQDFGTVKKSGDVLMILRDSSNQEIYVGHFLDVPEEFWDTEIMLHSRILDSSDFERIGAHVFTLVPNDDELLAEFEAAEQYLKEHPEKMPSADELDAGFQDVMERLRNSGT